MTGDTSPTDPRSTPSVADELEDEDELELPQPIKNKDKNKALIIKLIFFMLIKLHLKSSLIKGQILRLLFFCEAYQKKTLIFIRFYLYGYYFDLWKKF